MLGVAAVQFCPKAGAVDENLARIERFVADAASKGAALVVLPEICDLGYDLDVVAKEAQSFPNRSADFLAGLARSHKVVLVAGLAELRSGDIFNCAVVFDPAGDIVAKYDKTHLCPFAPADETKVFRAGDSIFVTEVCGVRLGVTICYDIRFPEIYRKLALSGAQVVVQPAAFAKNRTDQLEVCLRARAVENQIFMMAANCCKLIGQLSFGGRSMIVGPSGEVLAAASDTEEGVVYASIDLGEIDRIRRDLPVLSLRRPELYTAG